MEAGAVIGWRWDEGEGLLLREKESKGGESQSDLDGFSAYKQSYFLK